MQVRILFFAFISLAYVTYQKWSAGFIAHRQRVLDGNLGMAFVGPIYGDPWGN